jgi:hypothetical protein
MHPHDNQNRRLRTADAAAYCGIAKSTLEKMRVTSLGPIYMSLGRKGGAVVYDTDDLNTWLASKRRNSTSDIGPEVGKK